MVRSTRETERRDDPLSLTSTDEHRAGSNVGSPRDNGKRLGFGLRYLCARHRQRVTMRYRQRTTMVVECWFGRTTIPPKPIDEIVTFEQE